MEKRLVVCANSLDQSFGNELALKANCSEDR